MCGGHFIIHGTSNRLFPREVHSRKWMVNYLPWCDKRSVNPFWVLSRFRGFKNVLRENPQLFFNSKRAEGWSGSRIALASALQTFLHPFRVSVTSLLPSFVLLLQKVKQPGT
jgi:hypothetical protein